MGGRKEWRRLSFPDPLLGGPLLHTRVRRDEVDQVLQEIWVHYRGYLPEELEGSKLFPPFPSVCDSFPVSRSFFGLLLEVFFRGVVLQGFFSPTRGCWVYATFLRGDLHSVPKSPQAGEPGRCSYPAEKRV